MNATSISIASVLNRLIETCKDGQDGFRFAADDVKSADLKSLFHELSDQRAQFATELQHLVSDIGEIPEEGGSVSAVLHRGWIELKSTLTSGDEHAILSECERGEDSAVEAYRDALDHDEMPDTIRGVIRQQFMGVQAAHDRVRDLRDRFQK